MMAEKCNKRYEVIFVMKIEKGLLWSGSPWFWFFCCNWSGGRFGWLMGRFVLMARSLSSQLTLRMTSNSLSLFEVNGRRIYPHKVLWGRIQMLTHRILIFAARLFSFALPFFWERSFCALMWGLCPHAPASLSWKAWAKAWLVTAFCFGA